jgi:hypothetical protein
MPNTRNPRARQAKSITGRDGYIHMQALHDDLFRDYRKLPADELEARVLTILRAAGRGQHFSPEQWDVVDRMRARAVELKRATSAQGQERTMTATA